MIESDESTRDQTATSPAAALLIGGGAMGDQIRAHDWAATPLGPLESWPTAWIVALNLCLDMEVPATLFCGPDLRMIYNDVYTHVLADKHPWALGRAGREVWPEIWDLIGPQFAQVIATGRGFSATNQRLDFDRGDELEEKYFQYAFNPIRDETGRVTGVLNFAIDVTEQVFVEQRRVAEIERLRTMFEQVPNCIAVSRGPHHVFEIVNRAYRRVMGDRPLVGRPAREAVPELEAQGFLNHLDRVYTTGESFSARRAEVRLPQQSDDHNTLHFFDYTYQPITDATGAVTGIFVEGTDVTDQVIAEEKLRADEARRAFRAGLADALRDLGNPGAVMAVASEHLGRFFQVARVHYAEVDAALTVASVEREWRLNSVSSTTGRHPLAPYGPITTAMGQGQIVAVADVATDDRMVDPTLQATCRTIGTAAFLNVPIIKAGRLVAYMSLHSASPRVWQHEDKELIREVAERTWVAIERARAETSLRRSEARLRLALRGGRMGTWDLDLATRRLEASDTCKANYGRKASDPFTYDDLSALVLDADRPEWERVITDAIRGTTDFEVEHGVRWPDGTTRWVQVRGNCVVDGSGQVIGLSGVSFDVTERHHAAEREREVVVKALAAAEANAKFSTFFDQQWYFAGVLALDGTMVEVNRTTTDASGFDRSELVGRKFWDCGFWSPAADLVERIRVRTLAAAEGQPFHAEMRYFVADGSEREVDLHLNPVADDAGRIMFVAAFGIDITDRKQTEANLRSLAAELSDADHRKDEFLAMLGHELRNPLAAISGAVQLAEITETPELLGEFRELIQRQVVHLTRLIDDLLDVSRITQGKITLQPVTVDLATIVNRAVDLVRPIVTDKRHTLNVAIPDRPVPFVADPTRAEQILANLLTNAAKYTEPAGRIDLTATVEGAEVVIQVRDNGVGISPEMLPEVFGLFTQVDATIDRSQGGLGIGLTLVRNLVEMHDGTIHATSAGKGHGSEFTVRLPIGEPAALPLPAASPRRPLMGTVHRVLVVDDNRDTARLTARMLRHVGFEVETAHDGLEAVQRAPQIRPTVVLLDIGLPGMNGYEVACALRRDADCKDATIIAISGYGEDKARDRSAAVGFDHHLAKPVDFNRLMDLIGG